MLNPAVGTSSVSQALSEVLLGPSGRVESKSSGSVRPGGRLKGSSEDTDFSSEMQAMASALALQNSPDKGDLTSADAFRVAFSESTSQPSKGNEKPLLSGLDAQQIGDRSGVTDSNESLSLVNKLSEFKEEVARSRRTGENPQGLTDPGALLQSRNSEVTLERAGVEAGQVLSQPAPWNARWVLGRTGVFSDPSKGGTPVTPLFGEGSLFNGVDEGAFGSGVASPSLMSEGLAGRGEMSDLHTQGSSTQGAGAPGLVNSDAGIDVLLRAFEANSMGSAPGAGQVAEQKGTPAQLSGSEFLSLRDAQMKSNSLSTGIVGGSFGQTAKSLDEAEVSKDELATLQSAQGRPLKNVKGSPSEKIQGIPLLSERSKRDRGDSNFSEDGGNFGSSIPTLTAQWSGGPLEGGPRVGTQASKFSVAHEVNASVVPGAGAKERLSTDSLTGIAGNIRSFATQGGANGGVGEMRIRLRPEALGELTLKVRTQGQEVGLEFHASSEQARKVIEESMQYLRDKLGSHHLSLNSVEVSVGQLASMGTSFDGSSSSQQQQNSQQSAFQNANSFQNAGNATAFGQTLSDSSGGRSGAREDRSGDSPGLSPVRAGSSGLSGVQAMQNYRGNLGGRGRIDVKV
jgi:hypothetical protein